MKHCIMQNLYCLHLLQEPSRASLKQTKKKGTLGSLAVCLAGEDKNEDWKRLFISFCNIAIWRIGGLLITRLNINIIVDLTAPWTEKDCTWLKKTTRSCLCIRLLSVDEPMWEKPPYFAAFGAMVSSLTHQNSNIWRKTR